MATANFELPTVSTENDLDLDVIDATLPWLSGFPCDECKMTFATEDEVNKHKKLLHKRFLCEYCGKLCASNHGLKRHIDRMHPWQCLYCEKRFDFFQDLDHHLRTFQVYFETTNPFGSNSEKFCMSSI